MNGKLPKSIKPLLDEIVSNFRPILGEKLVGIYIHGSVALGSFNFDKSDVDLLVVVKDPLSVSQKQKIINFTLGLNSGVPRKGLEYSIVTVDQIKDFKYPTPFELHYSDDWKEKYQEGKVNLDMPVKDADLAAHFRTTKAKGICIYGEPIEKVIPNIPETYYWQSIRADAESIFRDIGKNPVYGILNLCRVAAYKKDKLIVSKEDGGKWGLENLDKRFYPLISRALKNYSSGNGEVKWNKEKLSEFVNYIKVLIG